MIDKLLDDDDAPVQSQSSSRYATSLRPGDALVRGEFLCRDSLRLGIESDSGRLMLGFAASDGVEVADGEGDGTDCRLGNSTSAVGSEEVSSATSTDGVRQPHLARGK